MKNLTETLYRREELEDYINEMFLEIIDNESKQNVMNWYNSTINDIQNSDCITNKGHFITLINNYKQQINI